MADASFYVEAKNEIMEEIADAKKICTKYGVTPEYVAGYIAGLGRSLQILTEPKLTKEGYI